MAERRVTCSPSERADFAADRGSRLRALPRGGIGGSGSQGLRLLVGSEGNGHPWRAAYSADRSGPPPVPPGSLGFCASPSVSLASPPAKHKVLGPKRPSREAGLERS